MKTALKVKCIFLRACDALPPADPPALHALELLLNPEAPLNAPIQHLPYQQSFPHRPSRHQGACALHGQCLCAASGNAHQLMVTGPALPVAH